MFLRYALIAEAVVETSGNKFNAIGIYDSVASWDFPCQHKFNMLIRLEGSRPEVGDHHLRIILIDKKSRQKIAQAPPDTFVLGANQGDPVATANIIIEESNVTFQKDGNYELLIIVDEVCLGSVNLSVVEMMA